MRGKNHIDGLKSRRPDNILFQHERDSHPNRRLEREDFIMKVTGSFSRPVVRLSQEGAMIAQAIRAKKQGQHLDLLNSKREFNQAGIVSPKFGRLF